MKNFPLPVSGFLLLALPFLFLQGCSNLPSDNGILSIAVYPCSTKTPSDVPDPGDFILQVRNSRGEFEYNGRFADSPEQLSVPAGTYEVSAYSREFSSPEYDSPQYGDSQMVTVQSGAAVSVSLNCVLSNSGVVLNVDGSFRSAFPEGTLYLKSSQGSLMHSYDESRTAFFLPGAVTFIVDDGYSSRNLFIRELPPRQILSLKLAANTEPSGTGISLKVDTVCNRVSESFVYGLGGDNRDNAYDVRQAKDRVGQEDIWVWGYIAGSFSSSTKMETAPPFTRNTNIVIASRTVVTDKSGCICVELKSGPLRDALNLVDHPEYLGRKVLLRGDVVPSYFSITGLKNISDFSLE